VGCVGMYCNCFGECADPMELGCADPVSPGCHTWITRYPTEVPTSSPTPGNVVYWGSKVCCFAENQITDTTSLVAQVLSLFNNQVKITNYKQFGESTEAGLEWEIIYEIVLEESDSTEAIMTSLEDEDVLNSVKESISTYLGIELQSIETISLSENLPTYAPTELTAVKYDQMGASIGEIIGVIAAIVLLSIVCYRFCIWKKLSESSESSEFCESSDNPISESELRLTFQNSIVV